MMKAVTDFEEGVTGKKKKKKKGGKKKGDKAAAAPAKKKEAEKPKTALSMPVDDEEEVDLVAKMEEARRAMPNAFVVSLPPRPVCFGVLWCILVRFGGRWCVLVRFDQFLVFP